MVDGFLDLIRCKYKQLHLALIATVDLKMFKIIFIVMLLNGFCHFSIDAAAETDFVNFTMISYGLTPPTILSSLPLVGPGFDMGLEKMQKTFGYNVNHIYVSPKNAVTCSDLADYVDTASESYYKNDVKQNLLAFILPGCDDLIPLGKLAREWNVLMLSSGLSYEELRNRRHYPTAVNNGPMQLAMFAEVFVSIFNHFSWTSIAVLLDTGAMAPFFKLWPTGLLNIVTQKQNNHINLQRFEFSSSKSAAYYDLLFEARKVSRVIILSSTPKIVRKFMIQASKMGMTNGEYVYFTVEPLRNNRYFGNLTWQYYDSDDPIAMDAYRSLKQLAPCYNERLDDDRTLFNELVMRAEHNYSFTYPKNEPPNAFVIAAHESVEMLGMVINETLHKDKSLLWNGRYLATQFLNKTFNLQYEDAFIDEVGERRSNYCISSLNATSKLVEPAYYYDARQRFISQMVDHVDWGNADGAPPKNRPRCGYLDNDIICVLSGKSSMYLIIGTTLLSLTVLLIVSAICCKRRITRETTALWDDWWMVDFKSVEFVQQRAVLSFSRHLTDLVTLQTKSQRSLPTARGVRGGGYGLYKDSAVWITERDITNANELVRFPHSDVRKLLWDLKGLNHSNVVRLVGISFTPQKILLLNEYCSKGSLNDVLIHGFDLDNDFKCSFLHDLIVGIKEIHSSPAKYHGFLTPEACLIDSRFTLKIGYLGFERVIQNVAKWSTQDDLSDHLSVASSTGLRAIAKVTSPRPASYAMQRKDLRSFGKIGTFLFDSYEVSQKRSSMVQGSLTVAPVEERCLPLFKLCKGEENHRDLCVNDVIKELKTIFGERNVSLMSRMRNMLDKYASRLERLVMERTRVLLDEQENCDKLLKELLPASLVEQLRKGTPAKAELYESATIYFGSLFGFQTFIQQHSPIEIADLLNTVYTVFDLVLPLYSVFKMETIADSYLVVSGIPERNGNQHAAEICSLALRFREACSTLTDQYGLELRSGINTGPCAAGVVGYKCPRFCIFGDTVNTASRMESHGLPSKIHVNASTTGLLLSDSGFRFVQRGIIFVKGKGECITYWLEKGE